MNHYRQSIILFGFALPLVGAAAAVVAAGHVRGRVQRSFADKCTHYASYQANHSRARALEAGIGGRRKQLNAWNETLRAETASTVTSLLREVSSRLPAKEFQQTSFNRPTNAAGFGSVSAQKNAPLELSFRANFRSMQRAFLELESRLPQLQLNELRIDLTPQSSNLNFQVTYTAWED